MDTLPSLDAAATAFHDNPCHETAEVYNDLALAYFTGMVISLEELDYILDLIWNYL